MSLVTNHPVFKPLLCGLAILFRLIESEVVSIVEFPQTTVAPPENNKYVTFNGGQGDVNDDYVGDRSVKK